MTTEVYENEREIRGDLTVTNDLSCENIFADNLPTIRKLSLSVDNVSGFDFLNFAGVQNGHTYETIPNVDFTNMFDGDINTWALMGEIEVATNFVTIFTDLKAVYEGFFVCNYSFYSDSGDAPYAGPVYFRTFSLNISAGNIAQPFFTYNQLGFKSDYIPGSDYMLSGSFCVPFYGDHVGLNFYNIPNSDAKVYCNRWDVYVFE